MLIIGNKVKKVLKHKYPLKAANDNVTKKDILDILFPDGCTEFAVADDNDLEILHANNPASNTKPYSVLCDQFKKPTSSASKTMYTNVINHARKYYGNQNLQELVSQIKLSADST